MPQGRGNGRNEAILRKLNRARVDEANEADSQYRRDRHNAEVKFQNSLPPGGSKSVKASRNIYQRKPGQTVKIRGKSLKQKLSDYWDDTINFV